MFARNATVSRGWATVVGTTCAMAKGDSLWGRQQHISTEHNFMTIAMKMSTGSGGTERVSKLSNDCGFCRRRWRRLLWVGSRGRMIMLAYLVWCLDFMAIWSSLDSGGYWIWDWVCGVEIIRLDCALDSESCWTQGITFKTSEHRMWNTKFLNYDWNVGIRNLMYKCPSFKFFP